MPHPLNDPWTGGFPDPDDEAISHLVFAAYRHNMESIRDSLRTGVDINAIDPVTGLAALHVAVGNNDIVLCQFLVEECGARFFPDRFGRWPSVVAAECRVDDELSTYVVSNEARHLMQG